MKPEVRDWANATNDLVDQQKSLQERERSLESAERTSLAQLASEGVTGDELIARYAGILSQYSDYRRLSLLAEVLKLQHRLLAGEPIVPMASVFEIDTIVRPKDSKVSEAQPWIDEESYTLVWRVQTHKHPEGITVTNDTLVGSDAIMQQLATPTASLEAASLDELDAVADMYQAIGEFATDQAYLDKAAELASVHLRTAEDASVPDLANDLMALGRASVEKFEDFLRRLAIHIAEDDYSRKYYDTNLKLLEAIVYFRKHRKGVPVGTDSHVVDEAEVLEFYQSFKARGKQLLATQANQEQ